MRALLLLPLALIAAPAAAQQAAAPAIPPELTSPETAAKLANAMQALSRALLDLKVGEVEAAIEGRVATPQDRRRTIRDSGRASDPEFERKLQQQIAQSRPMIEQSMKALAASLPAIMKSLEGAGDEMEKAVANMPSPAYPKR